MLCTSKEGELFGKGTDGRVERKIYGDVKENNLQIIN